MEKGPHWKSPYYESYSSDFSSSQASIEYLFFDDEDRTNHNKHSSIAPYGLKEDLYNTRIYYCYYQPGIFWR